MLDAQRALSQVLDSCTLAQMRMMAIERDLVEF
jgi:hypothetical protein